MGCGKTIINFSSYSNDILNVIGEGWYNNHRHSILRLRSIECLCNNHTMS